MIVTKFSSLGKTVANELIETTTPHKNGVKRKRSNSESSDVDTSDSEYEVEENVAPTAGKAGSKANKKEGFEVVSQDPGL